MIKTNPFPGMNPFLQSTWPDVHLALIAEIRVELGISLPDELVARSELAVEVTGGFAQRYRPDVAITDEGWKSGLPPVWAMDEHGGGTMTVTEPQLVIEEAETQRWIEISDQRGELITVIELLSPVNKQGLGRKSYLAKQRDYVAAGINLVEIDLLRGGKHTVDLHRDTWTQRYATPGTCYAIVASRGCVPGRREVYPCPLRAKLPTIRVPLRPTDPDVPLDIQALVNRCYTTGRYWQLNYAQALIPPLAEDEAIWACGLVREALP